MGRPGPALVATAALAALLLSAGCGSTHPLARDLADTTVLYLPPPERPTDRTKAGPVIYTPVAKSPHLERKDGVIARKLDAEEMEYLLDVLVDAGLDDLPRTPSTGELPGPQSVTIESGGEIQRWDGRSSAISGDPEHTIRFTRCVLALIQGARSEYQIESRRE